jgi:hypothetical protein
VFYIEDAMPPTADMRLRFIAADEGDGSLVEAAVDDVRILDFSSSVAVDPRVGPPFAFAPAAPNPFAALTRLRFTLPAGGAVRVRVFDPGGRLVRTLADRFMAAGAHGVVWDGQDDAGRAVSSGVYFVKLETGSVTQTRKVVYLAGPR